MLSRKGFSRKDGRVEIVASFLDIEHVVYQVEKIFLVLGKVHILAVDNQ